MSNTVRKTCRECGALLPVASFRRLKKPADPPVYYSYCKSCEYGHTLRWRANNRDRYDERLRRSHLRRAYGITPEEYDALLAAQGGTCALCSATSARVGSTMRLAVDHDHRTGRVRGLVCNKHNSALADFGDHEQGLLRALDYVRGDGSAESESA